MFLFGCFTSWVAPFVFQSIGTYVVFGMLLRLAMEIKRVPPFQLKLLSIVGYPGPNPKYKGVELTMGKFSIDKSLQARMHQYQIVGRAAPTPKNPRPKIFRMRLFARNVVLAKSRFWYYMNHVSNTRSLLFPFPVVAPR